MSFNPDPLHTQFSPWHACGPASTYPTYSAAMQRHADLKLLGVRLRLKPGEEDTHTAARQWEYILGVKALGSMVYFTNVKMEFVKGVAGEPEGIIDITIGVHDKSRLRGILETSKAEGCLVHESLGAVDMLGVRFFFLDIDAAKSVL